MKFENNSGKNKSYGFYVAVGLCFAAVCLVAVSSVINNKNAARKPSASSVVEEQQPEIGAWNVEETIEAQYTIDEQETTAAVTAAATTTTAPTSESMQASAGAQEDIKAVPVQAVVYSAPIEGKVAKGFSGTELVFCSTMGDWRVHQGLDLTGEQGSEVRAAADGEVVDFVEDMLYGYTAVIRQADDSMMYYCGLSSEQKVTAGLQVRKGDVIGYLGEVPCESADGPHIHLALMKEGLFVDPAAAMGLLAG